MKKLGILLGLLSIAVAHSQTFKFYRVGQDFEMNDNACLIIKNDYRTLLHINALEKYKDVKTIKFVGFNKPSFDVDSIIKLIPEEFTNIKCLMFEDCDLYTLTNPLTNFPLLEEVRVLKKCAFDENSLYYTLKDNSVKTMYLQKEDPDFSTDSLHLLKSLNRINMSNNANYTFSNKTNSYRMSYQKVPRDITIGYYGTMYKPESKKILAKKTKPKAAATFKNEKLSCIKQPVPGININDTSFSFNSSADVELAYKSGSIIHIDKNSFVTKDGLAYNGPVKLSYREFRNPVEIMLSGIPMTTKSESGDALFRSGGMYEVYAYDNKGNALNTRSDSSLKINFALTDTASDFKFYTLQDNGSWVTKNNSVNVSKVTASSASNNLKATKAVIDYVNFLNARYSMAPDTTPYEKRFFSNDYAYTYRKDNIKHGKDSNLAIYTYKNIFGKDHGYVRGLFRVKYKKMTKDKEIIFTIVPSRKGAEYLAPDYIAQLFDKTFVYTGDLNKEDFRNTYCRKAYYWDLRQNSLGNTLDLKLKTVTAYINLTGKEIYLQDKNTYIVAKKHNRILNTQVYRAVARDARKFNRKDKNKYYNYNNLNPRKFSNSADEAFAHCKKFQTADEKAMDFTAWKKYVNKVMPNRDIFSMQYENSVGQALVKSGLGVQNIDCYIHSGQMENILVNYKAPADSIAGNYCAMLYKSINTSYPLSPSYLQANSLSGYYFKRSDNYIIRFSDNGYMQVTKPDETKSARSKGNINLNYTNQYLVKNMNSNDITRLILD